MRLPIILRALLAITMATSIAHAQQLPDGLRHVPPDAIGFVHIRVGDFLKSPIGVNVLDMIKKDREASKGIKEIEAAIGITPADVDTVTLVMLPLPASMIHQFGIDREMYGPGPRRYPEKKARTIDFDMKKEFAPPKIEERFEKREIFEDKLAPAPKLEFKLEPAKKAVSNPLTDGMHFVTANELQHFHDEFDGPDVFLGPLAFQPVIIITASKDLDRKAILRNQFFGKRRHDPYGSYDNGPSVQFLSDRCVAVAMGFQLARFNDLQGRDPQPKSEQLKSALALAAGKNLVAGGGQLPEALRQMMNRPHGPDTKLFAMVSPLLATRSGAAMNFDKGVELTLQFEGANANATASAHQALKTLQALGQVALEQGGNGGEAGGWVLDLQRAAVKSLDNAKIERTDNLVRANLNLDISSALMKKFTTQIVSTVRSRGDRVQSTNNLKQIALAMHGYHDANKRLPPAGLTSINDPNGKPLLSWRVAILPYIDQAPLFQQFDLTQPWDHPTNKKLIANMPAIYMVPGVDEKEGVTNYRVLVGPQTMFEPNQRITLVGVTDGTSNTIMAVEAAEGTIWTRPDDLPFNPNGPLPKFGVTPDGFLAAFGDATVRFIRAGTPENDIRAFITRNGGEAVTLP